MIRVLVEATCCDDCRSPYTIEECNMELSCSHIGGPLLSFRYVSHSLRYVLRCVGLAVDVVIIRLSCVCLYRHRFRAPSAEIFSKGSRIIGSVLLVSFSYRSGFTMF